MLDRVTSAADAPQGITLVEALRESTKALHVRAERTGIVAELLRGRGTIRGYALLLRNLLPVYQALELALSQRAGASPLGLIVRPELARASAICADLDALAPLAGSDELALLPEAQAYVQAVEAAAEGSGVRLAAHAYARYLGDLSGGQILKRLLAKSPGVPLAALTVYDFPEIDDVAAYKDGYRAALDRIGEETGEVAVAAAEGARAFELNIALSCAVQDSA